MIVEHFGLIKMTLLEYCQRNGSSKAGTGSVQLNESEVTFIGIPLNSKGVCAFIPVIVNMFGYTYVLFEDSDILYIDSKKRASCFSFPNYKQIFNASHQQNLANNQGI